MTESDGNWDMVITSLQDICNANVSVSFDNLYAQYIDNPSLLHDMDPEKVCLLKQEIADHKANVATAQRLIANSQLSLNTLIQELKDQAAKDEPSTIAVRRRSESLIGSSGSRAQSPGKSSGNDALSNQVKKTTPPKKVGRLFFVSKYNPLDPIVVGSEIAYKLRNRHLEEWIQCEVMKVFNDGVRFEIRDPEPDENNNPGQTFRATYREILLIPPAPLVKALAAYPYGAKVLARYPETTTFYTAIVVGTKKDGSVRLKFDGEEEVNKETEVDRRSVLPFPEK